MTCIWNPDSIKATSVCKRIRWIILNGMILLRNWRCTIGVVYGGYSIKEQQVIYTEINQAIEAFTDPVLLMGDYNQILNVLKRRGQVNENNGMVNSVLG